MDNFKSPVLPASENIIEEVTATFEIREFSGISYKFAKLIVTNKALILYTEYPFTMSNDITIYDYRDIIKIDVMKSLILFNNGVSVVVKLVNTGNAKKVLETIRITALYTPGIRNFHQNSSGI